MSEEESKKVLHLKENPVDLECSRCKADISKDGSSYTYIEATYRNPPPGYVKCKSLWAE